MIPPFLLPLNRFQSCYIHSRSDPFLMRPFRPRFLHFSVRLPPRVATAIGHTGRSPLVFHAVGLQMQTSSGRISRRAALCCSWVANADVVSRISRRAALCCSGLQMQTSSGRISRRAALIGPGSWDLAVWGIFLAYQMPLWAFPGASQKRNTKPKCDVKACQEMGFNNCCL
jgi:hypothetical protein